MLVVTSREGEERGICSTALEELLKVVKDQSEERSVVVIVLNEESAIWKDASMETLSRDDQLKYIDVEGMRVVTKQQMRGRTHQERQSGERRDEWSLNWKSLETEEYPN